MTKELILKAINDAYSFVREQKQSDKSDELLINLFKAKALVENLPIHDVIGLLSVLADKLKFESNSTIPLPIDIEERSYKQGKQEAYAHAYIELKMLIDDL